MADESVRAIVLTGANGTFCAGGDISGFDDMDQPLRRRMPRLQGLAAKIAHSEKPVVSAVEGGAFGGGLSVALLADQVISADNARFCASFAKIGLMPDVGLLATLTARVGIGRAKEICMLAEDVSAADALADGMVDELTPPGQALARATEVACEFAAMAPLALGYTKAMTMRWPMTLSQELAWEGQLQGILFSTDDLQEGRTAFFEKRKPAFRGE
jgi:enoyl-CoA hydratase/carnithine racemase